MKQINFPLDFIVEENPYISNVFNYTYERPDGSIICIMDDPDNGGLYEVWDENHMEIPELMDFIEIVNYLNSSIESKLCYQFMINEIPN